MEKVVKVIKGLECCMSETLYYKCPYKAADECEDGGYFYSKAIEDAITLLREQEPVKPELRISKHGFRQWLVCGACKNKISTITFHANYCPYCGKAVKWE